jgi:hypothetical protein
MVFHGEKCRHCRSNMSEPKVQMDGPKKGWLRSYCINCGHIEFRPPIAGAGGQQQQQPQPKQRPARPATTPPPGMSPRPVNPFQPVLLKKPPY